MLAVLAMAAFLQAGPAVDSVEKGSIAGQVTNALTGEPLNKAKVTLRRSGSPAGTAAPAVLSVSSDASGHFEFPSVYPGDCTLTASRTGFSGETLLPGSATGTSLPIALAPGQKANDLKLRLTPQGVIAGRVVDENGEPARSVSVYAMRPAYAQGVRRLGNTGVGAQSNDLGEYRIYGLTPGRYYVRTRPVSASLGTAGLPNAADQVYPGVFYPNAPDPDTATRVEVQAGTESGGINFTLRPARAVRLRGRVVDGATGQVPQRASVRIFQMGADDAVGMASSVQADAKGAFEIGGLLPGSYTIAASGVAAPNTMLSVRENVEVGKSGLDGVQVRLAPGAELAGSVRTDGTSGADKLDFSKLRVLLSSREGGAGAVLASGMASVVLMASGPAGAMSSGRVDAEGNFALPGVSPSRYDPLIIGLPESFYLKSVRFENQETTNTGFEVAGPGRYRLELAFSGDGAQVEGVVLDSKDKPAAQATVVLIPADRAPRLYKNTTTAQNGQFALKSIPPGKYRIYAWEGVEQGIWFDPDFMALHEKDGESVSCDAKERKTTNLKLRSITEGQSR